MCALPPLPDVVRIMVEGLDLRLRQSATLAGADLIAERAYGFVIGMETAKALSPGTIDALYRWVETTYADVVKSLRVIDP